jgi:uncharacterized membrane-anchored protein YhcB (DUF1043 family)
MHRGGVFLPPARVTVRINEKEKEKKPLARPAKDYSQKVSPLLSISFQGAKECHKKVRRFE